MTFPSLVAASSRCSTWPSEKGWASDLDIDFVLYRPWQWPAWKFSLDQAELHTTLHARFNSLSTQLPLQGLEAFHHDVSEMAHCAPEDDVATFHALLAACRDVHTSPTSRKWWGMKKLGTW